MKWIVTFLLFYANNSCAQRQVSWDTLRYDVVLSAMNIGKMLAIRENGEDGKIEYTLISDVNVNALLFKVKLSYVVKSTYQNEVLQFATVDTKTNKGIFHSEISKDKEGYTIKAHQYGHDLETATSTPIKYSVAKAFFNEPTGQNEVFGEYLGDYLSITPKSNGLYVFEREKQRDLYTYKKGKVNTVGKKFKFLNYIIKRTDK